jgi:hypothetical protein
MRPTTYVLADTTASPGRGVTCVIGGVTCGKCPGTFHRSPVGLFERRVDLLKVFRCRALDAYDIEVVLKHLATNNNCYSPGWWQSHPTRCIIITGVASTAQPCIGPLCYPSQCVVGT